MRIKLVWERVLSKKKVSWSALIGVLVLIAACLAAYSMTRLPEKNARLQVMQAPSA
jgi:hypothetical protein